MKTLGKVNYDHFDTTRNYPLEPGIQTWNHYIYTTKSDWKDGKFKWGDTERDDVRVRIEEQVGQTSNGSEPIALASVTNVIFRDHRVHAYIKKYLKKTVGWVADAEAGVGKEWFVIKDAPSTFDDFLKVVGKIIDDVITAANNGRLPRTNTFDLRDEQRDFVEKAGLYFEKRPKVNKFLLAAKMRFGKTFSCYKLCERLKARNALVLSWKTASKASWRDDLEDHTAFEGCNFYDYKACGESKPTFDAEKMNVFFVSVQALMTGKWNWVYEHEWDMILYDEEHYGKEAPEGRKILRRFDGVNQVHMSGTAFRSMRMAKFGPDNTFSWTYNDEQEKKRVEKQQIDCGSIKLIDAKYQCMPRMNFIALDIDEEDKAITKIKECFQDSENPCFKKVLASDKAGLPLYPGALRAITSKLWDTLDNCDLIRQARARDHLLVIVPGVREAKLLETQLKQDANYKEYHVINAAGSDSDIVDSIDEVKKLIDSEERTITISCGRFGEAVTVPEWTTVVLLSDIKSPAKYFQTVFRTQSAWSFKNGFKEECYVIDFSLERILSATYEMVFWTKPAGTDLTKWGTQWLRNAPIHSYRNSMVPRQIQFDEMFKVAMSARDRVGQVWGSGGSVNVLHVFSEEEKEMLSKLKNVSAFRGKIEKIVKEGKDNLKNGKAKKFLKGKVEKDDEVGVDLNKLLLAACEIERRLPRYLLISDRRERCLDDLLTPTGEQELETAFEQEIGVRREEFGGLISAGLFDSETLDDMVGGYAILDQEYEKIWEG